MKGERFKSAVTGKVIITATVTNVTNMLIASGNDEHFNFEVIKTHRGIPFIPASSFAGMIRSHFEDKVDHVHADWKELFNAFWGTRDAKETDTYQSHLIVDDLYLAQEKCYPSVRDGVSIDYADGVATNKYDYEFIPPGSAFSLNMEVTLRDGMDKKKIKEIVKFIVEEGIEKKYFQGAFTSHYFGILKWQDVEISCFDFSMPGHADAWFNYLESCRDKKPFNWNVIPELKWDRTSTGLSLPQKKQPARVVFEALFSIKNTLLIGSPNYEFSTHTDKTHLTNAENKPVISAKSFRGALRHRCNKIMNTMGAHDPGLVDDLFGFVEPESRKARKGRFRGNEAIIEGHGKHQQFRIKICRLTGKNIDGALINEEMIAGGNFNIQFEIEGYSEKEMVVVLLALKDMIHEDLPLGGNKTIGRGVLLGESLSVLDEKNGYYINWKANDKKVSYSKEWEPMLTTPGFKQ